MSLSRLSARFGSPPAAIASKQGGKHGLEGLTCRRRAERARFARPPICNVALRGFDVRQAELPELDSQDSRIIGQARTGLRRETVKNRPDAFHARPQQVEQGVAAGKPMQLRDIVERLGTGRQEVGLRIVDHLHAMLDGPKQSISSSEIFSAIPRPAGPLATSAPIASSVAGARTDRSRPPWIIC